MVVSELSPEEQAKNLLMVLHSSNLHYSAQVTPFSIYITVRKKFRKTSKFVIPAQTSPQPSESSLSSEELLSLNRELENKLKQKALAYDQLKVAKEFLEKELEKAEEKGEKAEDCKVNLEEELEEKYLESHELKMSNDILQEKLKKAEAEYAEYCKTVKEGKENLDEKIEFLVSSVKRSTEERLLTEKKLTDANKVIKKNGQKLETLEQCNKMLRDKNEKLKSDMKLFKNSATLNSVSSKSSQTGLSLLSGSPDSSTMESVPESNYQQTNQNSPQVSSLCNPNAQERKPFPPSIVTQDLVTFKPFPPTGSLGPGKLFLPFQNFTIGEPFVPSQDGNNNPTVDNERSESINQTESVNVENSTRDAINKGPFKFGKL